MTDFGGGDDHDSLERLIHVFHRMFHSCMRHEMDRRGIQECFNPMILMTLHRGIRDQVPMTQRRIASHLGVSPPSVAVSIKRMERAGLVRKEADPRDQRRKTVTLTEQGQALMDQCHAGGRDIYQQLTQGFSPQELELLQGFYMRMIRNLSPCVPRPPAMIQLSDLEE